MATTLITASVGAIRSAAQIPGGHNEPLLLHQRHNRIIVLSIRQTNEFRVLFNETVHFGWLVQQCLHDGVISHCGGVQLCGPTQTNQVSSLISQLQIGSSRRINSKVLHTMCQRRSLNLPTNLGDDVEGCLGLDVAQRSEHILSVVTRSLIKGHCNLSRVLTVALYSRRDSSEKYSWTLSEE